VDQILQEFDEPHVTAVELDPFRANVLRRKYADDPRVEVIEADFMRWAAGAYGRRQFDTVVMNPPFSVKDDSLAYVNHIALAWSLLAPDGQLASIVPSGINFQDSSFVKRLRQMMKQKGAVDNLPELAFKEAGTGTRTAFCYGNKWVPPLVVRKDPPRPVVADSRTGQMAFF
jgi:predicted RNA methylase